MEIETTGFVDGFSLGLRAKEELRMNQSLRPEQVDI